MNGSMAHMRKLMWREVTYHTHGYGTQFKCSGSKSNV